ncbi:ABC transporter ATP-binding protein [Winogradskyella undariae]|uniref:ABC transporter ATP-binding protein n=1 Tax=Winogradskyella undariae TaxID=1285465 RepID=UPI00156B66A7|nr:ABC transporter ATP-binding protein [Winogradskyella undariae]NRR92002.1 ABC transporter ATP-binding protein [Winogradskyella undariae]
MSVILKAENISKQYRLGVVGTGTISHDLNRWWARIRGKEDPYLKVGAVNDRSTKADSAYVWALKSINFEVQKGEVLGIIGKNGAGKSTLLKILSRVTIPTTGEIKTRGRIASLLEVGTGFHPELTGRENMYLNGAILGMTKAEIKAKEQEIIEFSGCERYVDTPVKRYSSGMRVRLAFAVAAFLEPDILVIDEVLAVGDAEFQKKAIGKMQDISKGDGRTVLFVSHNMAAVKNLCTRAIVLENGTSVFEGATDEAVDFYLSQNKKQESIPLEERKDRSGNGDFLFKDISILNTGNEALTSLLSGDFYKIKICLKTIVKQTDVKIRIQFIDNKGAVRFLCNSYFVDTKILNLEKSDSNYIEFQIAKFPLPIGNYLIQLTGVSTDGIQDDIENALEFNVVGGDFFKSGREQISKEGVLVEYTFKKVFEQEDLD